MSASTWSVVSKDGTKAVVGGRQPEEAGALRGVGEASADDAEVTARPPTRHPCKRGRLIVRLLGVEARPDTRLMPEGKAGPLSVVLAMHKVGHTSAKKRAASSRVPTTSWKPSLRR